MQSAEVPKDVCSFLSAQIESYEQLEILLLLRRERSASWTAKNLSTRLRLSEPLVIDALSALSARRLVETSPGVPEPCFAAAAPTPALDETMNRLADLYANRPIEIIKLMSTNAMDRVRTAALRTFVDAFVLRKEKDDG